MERYRITFYRMIKKGICVDNPTISTWGNFFIKTLVLLSITPLVISRFSVGEIALWYLFLSIQSLGHLFDIGFSSTIIRFTAYCLALGKEKWKDAFYLNYGAMNTIFSILSLTVLLFLMVMGFTLVDELLVKYSIEKGWLAWLAICVCFPINFYFKKNDAFLKGLNEIALVNNWNSIFYLINGIISLFVILVLKEFYILVIWNQFFLTLNSIKNYFLLKKKTQEISLSKFSLNIKIIKEFWSPTWKSSLISLSSQGSVHISSLVISSMLTVEIVASYLFTLRFLQLINEFSWAPFYSQIPRYINLFKKGQFLVFRDEMLSRLQLSICILLFGGLLFFILSPHLITWIDSNVDILSWSIGIYVLLALIVERLISTHSQILMFANDLRHYKLYIILGFVYILLIQGLRIIPLIELLPISYIISAIIPGIFILKRVLITFRIKPERYFFQMKFLYGSIVLLILVNLFL